jgi:dephospho-CoA kinase
MGQRIIGLTGGIATGKSTVSDYLQHQHQLPVLDADLYARQAVEPGSPILAAIAQRYGPDLLRPDGSLRRDRLGEIIFAQAEERRWLEAQTHPFVRQRFAAAMAELSAAPTVVQAIPLLFEAGLTGQVSEVWVVVCSAAQQRQRLIARSGLTSAQAQARIDSQWPLADKAAQANVVLDNSADLAALFAQVDAAVQPRP